MSFLFSFEMRSHSAISLLCLSRLSSSRTDSRTCLCSLSKGVSRLPVISFGLKIFGARFEAPGRVSIWIVICSCWMRAKSWLREVHSSIALTSSSVVLWRYPCTFVSFNFAHRPLSLLQNTVIIKFSNDCHRLLSEWHLYLRLYLIFTKFSTFIFGFFVYINSFLWYAD